MNYEMFLPDYDCSILGIPNSILSHYGAKPHHKTLPVLDEKFRQDYKNVVLLVLDGMGMEALKAHSPNGFLANNCVAQLSSVYPCTTVSALTTLETGLTPIEHGWLGWAHYFKELGKSVELYTNKESGTEKSVSESFISWQTIGFKNIFTQIQEANASIECCRVSPFGEYQCDTNEAICNHIEALCKKDGRRYIYAYHFQPDKDMHHTGCYSERTKANITLFNLQIEQMAKSLTDTLLIITADHGLVDTKLLDIEDYPEIWHCLYAPPTREPRSLSFFVKDECKAIFPEIWIKYFKDSFIFMTGDEAFENTYFGSGRPHKRAREFLGDYVAIATGDLSIWFRNENGVVPDYIGLHAGLCHDEMVVPLIIN
jgi:predicted AlkP superfamily pyrophosphatase or phosphodiesterase